MKYRTNEHDIRVSRRVVRVLRTELITGTDLRILIYPKTAIRFRNRRPDISKPVIRLLGCWRYTKLCLGWKTCEYYSETDELPNPRKISFKSGIWATFSRSKYFVRGLGMVLYRKQTTRNLTQPNSPQTP